MRTALWLACALAVLPLAGCESTVDLARKISRHGELAMRQRMFAVTRADRRIHTLGSSVIQDPNGTAVVVELRSTARGPIVDAPIAITVKDRAGRSVFRNNLAGAAPALTHVPLLPPGQVVDWINDQVEPSGSPARVAVRVGTGSPPPAVLPSIMVSGVTLTNDPVSGEAISGRARNTSAVAQTNLTVFAVARRAGRIVAAGRAILVRLAPGQSVPFHAYVIGNPRGAQLSAAAPPSVMR